jgi:glycosyltransferase involved in cell wall biosynthesis
MRIAIISPFVDRKHGTERVLAELIERLVSDYHCEIYLYSQRVEDLAMDRTAEGLNAGGQRLWWYKVPSIPGPHLVQYIFWLAANTLLRFWHRRSGKIAPDLLFSPGINAWDADVIHVHIVFEEFYERMKHQLRFRSTPPLSWPLLLHRRMYYGLTRWLERQIYPRKQVHLAAVSGMVRNQLETYFHRCDAKCVLNGVNLDYFDAQIRIQRRSEARRQLNLTEDAFVFLLIGNDWRKKGLPVAIEAFGNAKDCPIRLLVVGRDDNRPFLERMHELDINDRITFLPPADDTMHFYAAADAYLGPSIEDAFGLPVLEAMACGLPVIASANAGVSEVIEDNVNGLVLKNPLDASDLATLIRTLVSDTALREILACNALKTAQLCTWDKSARVLWDILSQTLTDKRSRSTEHR